MAIEIIKPGQLKFTQTCSLCGCEFTYELEDVIGEVVVCPCCGNHITHTGVGGVITSYPYRAIPCSIDTSTNILSKKTCEECDFYKWYLTSGRTYLGDSPCQWCSHSPYRVSCVTATTAFEK